MSGLAARLKAMVAGSRMRIFLEDDPRDDRSRTICETFKRLDTDAGYHFGAAKEVSLRPHRVVAQFR